MEAGAYGRIHPRKSDNPCLPCILQVNSELRVWVDSLPEQKHYYQIMSGLDSCLPHFLNQWRGCAGL